MAPSDDPRVKGLGPPHLVKWGIYGRAGQRKAITQEYMNEIDATVALMQVCLEGEQVDAVVYRIDRYDLRKRTDLFGEQTTGKWRDVPYVVLRVGRGIGWWESHPAEDMPVVPQKAP